MVAVLADPCDLQGQAPGRPVALRQGSHRWGEAVLTGREPSGLAEGFHVWGSEASGSQTQSPASAVGRAEGLSRRTWAPGQCPSLSTADTTAVSSDPRASVRAQALLLAGACLARPLPAFQSSPCAAPLPFRVGGQTFL